jgi:tryptophan 2-monooxygenase
MGGVFLNTAVTSITGNISSGFTIHSASGTWPASRVIVATTTRAMELKLGLTKYGANAFIAPAVAQAIMRTHVVSSNKVAAQIIKFWPGLSQFRCLQTDGAAHQVYTLDYGVPGSAVCFMTYVWDDDAVKQQSITDGAPTGQSGNETIYKYLYSTIQAIGGEVANWAQGLRPLPNPNNPSGPPDYRDNVVFEEWQSSPYFGGAFKLSEPGQDQYVHDMFFDYQKAGTSRDTGLYIAGDCLAWTSGWVEGALTTGLNAAAAVLTSLGGTLNTDPRGKTPMSINAKRYNYFG